MTGKQAQAKVSYLAVSTSWKSVASKERLRVATVSDQVAVNDSRKIATDS